MQPCQPSHVPEKGCLHQAPKHHKGLACTGLPAQGTKTTHTPCLNRVACTRHKTKKEKGHIQCRTWKLHFEASKKLHFKASKLSHKNLFKKTKQLHLGAGSSCKQLQFGAASSKQGCQLQIEASKQFHSRAGSSNQSWQLQNEAAAILRRWRDGFGGVMRKWLAKLRGLPCGEASFEVNLVTKFWKFRHGGG